MIRLTVLYNLRPDVNEKEFLKWRLTEHQKANSSMPGVIHTDFARNDLAWPPNTEPKYRFMTTAEWRDMDAFNEVFYDPAFQEELQNGVETMLSDYVFLVGDVLISSEEKD